MKRENCIEVKHVCNLSVAYLTRLFGNVGPIVKIDKDEVSKYVTVEFANQISVDKAFRFNGRIFDERPIKIRKCREALEERVSFADPITSDKCSSKLLVSECPSLSLTTMDDIWQLIEQEIKPHHYDKNEQLLLSMFIWSLIDLLLTSAKHLLKFKVNKRSGYIQRQIERFIIDRLSRRTNAVLVGEGFKTLVEKKETDIVVWFAVPFPNIEEEQSKFEVGSSIMRCISSVQNGLSLRLAEIIYALSSASLCSNLEETRSQELINLNSQVLSTAQDNFMGVVENLGAKNIFHELLVFEQPNSCICLSENRTLKTFHCTLRLEGCLGHYFEESSWCNLYHGFLVRKRFGNETEYNIDKRERVEHLQLKDRILIFENGHFSFQGVEDQLRNFHQIQPQGAMVFYISKQIQQERTHEFKKVYEDDVMKILEEVQQMESIEKCSKTPEMKQEVPEQEEIITEIYLVEIKSENVTLFNNLKLTHYLEDYIQESVLEKGLIIASRQMAIKLAGNIIDREKQNRLFQFGEKRFQQFVGEELWRVYNRQEKSKIKNLISRYSRGQK